MHVAHHDEGGFDVEKVGLVGQGFGEFAADLAKRVLAEGTILVDVLDDLLTVH